MCLRSLPLSCCVVVRGQFKKLYRLYNPIYRTHEKLYRSDKPIYRTNKKLYRSYKPIYRQNSTKYLLVNEKEAAVKLLLFPKFF